MNHTVVGQADLLRLIESVVERAWDRPGITVIELLLIGGVVYAMLRFLHGTRGARLVRAVVIILVLSFAVVRVLATRFEFDRINVLYPYFVLAVFLVSLVAFQSELRRMLIRLGEGGWLHGWSKSAVEVVDPVVTAVERLSKRKIGALIAIERRTETGALIESGVRLDAQVSSELLETIFWPGSALHDLGVIIHGNRISAAGCQLPLVESGEVDRALGSRHRAALGMSHEADAVVIVVSEETGAISVAIRGRLRRSLTLDALRSTLTKELTPPARKRPRWLGGGSRESAKGKTKRAEPVATPLRPTDPATTPPATKVGQPVAK